MDDKKCKALEKMGGRVTTVREFLGLTPEEQARVEERLAAASKWRERRCRACGDGTIRLMAGPGRKTTYKFAERDVPADLEIPTCDRCGTEWHNDTTAAAFYDALASRVKTEAMRNGMRPIHPGEVLREEFVEPLGLSASALADELDLPEVDVAALLDEQCALTEEIATRLAERFGTSVEFWTSLQASFEHKKGHGSGGESDP